MYYMKLSVFALTLMLSYCQNCQADLIIEFAENHSMLSGTSAGTSTSTMDVFVRHANSSVEVGGFSLRFRISEPGSGTGVLRFLDPQSVSERSQSNYVLAGKDLTANLATSFQQSQRELIQSDSLLNSINLGETVIIGTTSRLLATLELEHQSATAVNGAFEISLVQDVNSTYFEQYNAGIPLPTRGPIAAVSYANRGAVVVSAVPEPSGLVLIGTTLMVMFLRRRRLRCV